MGASISWLLSWLIYPGRMYRLFMFKYDRPEVHRQIEGAIIAGIVIGLGSSLLIKLAILILY